MKIIFSKFGRNNIGFAQSFSLNTFKSKTLSYANLSGFASLNFIKFKFLFLETLYSYSAKSDEHTQ